MTPFPISALCFFCVYIYIVFVCQPVYYIEATLCLVPSYCLSGFPSPAIINMSFFLHVTLFCILSAKAILQYPVTFVT